VIEQLGDHACNSSNVCWVPAVLVVRKVTLRHASRRQSWLRANLRSDVDYRGHYLRNAFPAGQGKVWWFSWWGVSSSKSEL
jgi:hypothetical protein